MKVALTMRRPLFKLLRHDPDLLPYARIYLYSYVKGHFPLRDEVPSTNLRAIKFLDQTLTPQMTVFEWGSGGSTLFFAKRCQQVTCVEHQAEFYHFMTDKLTEKQIDNVTPILAEPTRYSKFIDLTAPHPLVTYQSSRDELKSYVFTDYARVIDEFPDGHFDLVLVDGRARVSCLFHGISKVRPGGMLMLDDSHRLEYKAAIAEMNKHYPVQHFSGVRPYHPRMSAATRISLWRMP